MPGLRGVDLRSNHHRHAQHCSGPSPAARRAGNARRQQCAQAAGGNAARRRTPTRIWCLICCLPILLDSRFSAAENELSKGAAAPCPRPPPPWPCRSSASPAEGAAEDKAGAVQQVARCRLGWTASQPQACSSRSDSTQCGGCGAPNPLGADAHGVKHLTSAPPRVASLSAAHTPKQTASLAANAAHPGAPTAPWVSSLATAARPLSHTAAKRLF